MGLHVSSPTFNVFLADYVDLDEDRFTKTVINLNYVSKGKGVEDKVPPEVTDLE